MLTNIAAPVLYFPTQTYFLLEVKRSSVHRSVAIPPYVLILATMQKESSNICRQSTSAIPELCKTNVGSRRTQGKFPVRGGWGHWNGVWQVGEELMEFQQPGWSVKMNTTKLSIITQSWERLRTHGSFCLLAIGFSLGGETKKRPMLRFGLN